MSGAKAVIGYARNNKNKNDSGKNEWMQEEQTSSATLIDDEVEE